MRQTTGVDSAGRATAIPRGSAVSRVAGEPLNVLLLCHFYDGTAGAILEHINAFPKYSRNSVHVLSNLGNLPPWLELDRFDAVIVHYSLIVSHDNYLSPAARTQLRNYKGFKAVFIQDDYRWINATLSALAYMQVNALFPLTDGSIMELVYPGSKLPNVRRETVLTGYVSEKLISIKVKPYSRRPIDVGYRARQLPAWMGAHTIQKWQIAERFAADAKRYKLRTDISCREEDRIYGAEWIDFIANCKAMLGTESGASVCDFTGEIQRNVESHLKARPSATFEELRNLYFKDVDGKILMNVISPRCFEAAALRTLMILYEGEYSGILRPWDHYVPLRRDHGNIGEVIGVMRHTARATAITERAYNEIALNERYTYRAMVNLVDRVIDEEFRTHMRTARPYTHEELLYLRRQNDPFVIVPGEPARRAVKSIIGRSPLRFYRGHGLGKALRGSPDLHYAAAVEDQGLPQQFEVRLLGAHRICHIAVIWESGENCAANYSVHVRRGRHVVLERRITDNRSRENHFEIAPTFADGILFCVQEFHGQQRLLLRSVQIISDGSYAGIATLRLLRSGWHVLPNPVRNRLRPLLAPVARALRLI